MDTFTSIILIGTGATISADAWALVRRHLLGTPAPDYALVGRWIAHMGRGRFHHPSIARSSAMPGELVVGWITHYVTGVVFAAVLVAICGGAWLNRPTPGPAIAVGIGTVAAPFLLMQPGMGAGIAARHTPHPNMARLHSLLTHTIFGLGLYATALAL